MLPNALEAKYEVLELLGKGAMGRVLAAMDRNIGRRVAIKLVELPAPDDADGAELHERFRREAQAAGRLSHPNIVAVHDYGEDARNAWIVMEVVEGGSLRALIDAPEPIPLAATVRIMQQICAALSYSHARGVVHRDIKPANIMLTRTEDGSLGDVKIADFGIARLDNSSLTQVGAMMGTPSSMAPEQLTGEGVDARADIWAAGVVLYQLLTRKRPFEGDYATVIQRVLNSAPVPPSQRAPEVPAAFDAVVAKALAKAPGDRFATAAQFAAAIRDAATPAPADDADGTVVSSAPVPPRAAPPPGMPPGMAPTAAPRVAEPRRKLPVALVGGGVAVLAAGAAFLLFGPSGPAPAPPESSLPAAQRTAAEAAAAEERRARERQAARAEAEQRQLAAEQAAAQERERAAEARLAAERQAAEQAAAQERQRVEQARQAAERAREEQARAAQRQAEWRAAAATVAESEPCALLDWQVDETGLEFSGIARRGGEASIRQSLQARGVAAEAVRLRLEAFDGPYCPLLDAVRPVHASPVALPQMRIANAQPIAQGEMLRFSVTMPQSPSHLAVSYLMQSGEVFHLVPSRPEPAGATVRLGDPAGTFPGWEIDEPFGTDLIVTFASDRPVLPERRPQAEPLAGWVAALATRLRAARAEGRRVSARVVLVETKPRR